MCGAAELSNPGHGEGSPAAELSILSMPQEIHFFSLDIASQLAFV